MYSVYGYAFFAFSVICRMTFGSVVQARWMDTRKFASPFSFLWSSGTIRRLSRRTVGSNSPPISLPHGMRRLELNGLFERVYKIDRGDEQVSRPACRPCLGNDSGRCWKTEMKFAGTRKIGSSPNLIMWQGVSCDVAIEYGVLCTEVSNLKSNPRCPPGQGGPGERMGWISTSQNGIYIPRLFPRSALRHVLPFLVF